MPYVKKKFFYVKKKLCSLSRGKEYFIILCRGLSFKNDFTEVFHMLVHL